MKRYLWTAIVWAFVGANASDNPFKLNENLKKIDQDQNILLSELKVLTEKKEKKEVQEEIIVTEKVEIDIDSNVSEIIVVEETEVVVIETNATEEAKINKIKEEQVKIEVKRAEKEKEKAEEERVLAEKLEVEKQELQRAEKIKREAEELAQLKEEKAKLESKKRAQESKNTEEKSEKPSEKKKSQENEKQKKVKTAKSLMIDINITREELESTEEANQAYQAAILEVNKED